MKRKKKVFIIIGLLLVICVYFGYKGFNLFYYNINNLTTENYDSIVNSLTIKDTITINTKKLESDDYLTFRNIKVKNEFSNFKLLENQFSDNNIKYALYDENNNLKASFWMGITDSYVNLFKTDAILFGTEDKRINNTNLTNFLDKNNIKNDIDLFKYLEKNKNVKNNIFTSVKEMKENYLLQFMVSVAIPRIENITLIDGDYQGYIFNMKSENDNISSIREARILFNDKVYTFLFLNKNNEYFNNDYIQDILNTIVID